MSTLKCIKLITFDATNTVLKFRVQPWQFYAILARDHGFTGSEELIQRRLLNSYKSIWEKYPNFGKSNIGWEEWWTQVVKKTFEGQLPVHKNVDALANKLIDEFKTDKCWNVPIAGPDLLHSLRNQNKTIGVISNFDPRLTEILQNLKLKDCFHFIVTSYEFGYCKPDERIFKHALEQYKNVIKPSEALHIGDDFEKDYEGAKAAGWHALLVTDKIKSIKSVPSSHLFNNLEELTLAIKGDMLKL